MKRKTPFFLTLAVGALISIPCFAGPMVLGINGNAEVGAMDSTQFINFGVFPVGPPYMASPNYGTFEVSLVNPGVFASNAVVPGEFGMIQSLNSSTTPVGVVLTPNPTTDMPFMKFNGPPPSGAGGVNLEVFLTELVKGNTVGPFTLADTPNGSTASFDINGFVYDTTHASRTQISGLFSATFAGTTVAQLLAMAAAGTTIPTPYSATFTITAVPEPISLFLMGAGLMGAGLVARRKVRR
jgi:PEP-CTERM motif